MPCEADQSTLAYLGVQGLNIVILSSCPEHPSQLIPVRDLSPGVMANIVLEVKENFIDLERHRLRLEENVAKLRESLQHWQTWEAEYEGMKEEIEGLSDRHTDTELVTESFQIATCYRIISRLNRY